MSYCLNIRCPKPTNASRAIFCTTCGRRLKLGDRFRAFQPIGVGYSSRTFLATDESKLANSRCIFKEYEQVGDGETLRREIMRLDPILQHPQIPKLYAYFERDSYTYLVQEFISGKSMLQEMQEFGAFDEPKIWAMLDEVLPVLQFLHTHRVIHRDVKPANLIRRDAGGKEGALVLVDFGSAKYATHSTLARVGTVIGSAEYVAPEQLLGQATFASDLYSLGVTCIHLLTGLTPFELINSANGQWVWRSVAGIVSDRLASIIDRLLEKSLDKRYDSVEALQWDVKAVRAEQSSLQVSPFTVSEPTISVVPDYPPTIEETWHCVRSDNVGVAVNAIALSRDWQDVYAAGNDGQVYRWSMDSVPPEPYLKAHSQPIEAIALRSDGYLATGSRDRTVKLWSDSELQHTLEGHHDIITAIAFDPSNQTLYSSSRDKGVHLWNVQTGALIYRFEHPSAIETFALNPPFLACGDGAGSMHLWHSSTRELMRRLAAHQASVSAVAMTSLEPMRVQPDPDRFIVISSGWDMEMRVRNFNTGGLHHVLKGHRLPVTAIALRSDGQRIATASHDGTVRLWNPSSPVSIATLSGQSPVLAIAFAEGGGLVYGRQDGTLECWQQIP